jgi:hypothetical protein
MAFYDSARQRTPWSHPLLAEALFTLDARLRRRHHVVEYSSHPSCIFRLDIARAPRGCSLSDGTSLYAGQRIARLHFWNEHIPTVPSNGATIGWAREMQRRIALSLRELDRYFSARPDLGDIPMISGDVPCGTRAQSAQLARIMAYYGFETIAESEHLPVAERLHRFGENILISLIVFVQNARALRLDSLNRVRVPIYISRRVLAQRFGAGSGSDAAA